MISKEAKRDYDKEYRKKNKEKAQKFQQEYYQTNKEKIKARIKKYRIEHPEKENKDKRKARSKRYRDNNPIKSRLSVWKSRGIKITVEDYKKIYKDQEGCCYICGVPEEKLKNKLCLDHNHKTGNPRGLLCHKCNSMIGFIERGYEVDFRDPIPILKNAISYISNKLDVSAKKVKNMI
jgi:hypothetical protein